VYYNVDVFTVLGVKKPYEEVVKFLEELFKDIKVLSNQISDEFITLSDKGDWTVIVIPDSMPMPALSLEVSGGLNCKVITLGYASIDGSFHYSELSNGNVIKLYSYVLDQVCEKEGLTLEAVYNTAIEKKQFNIMPGFEATEKNLEYGSQEYFSAYAEIDLLPYAYEKVSEDDKRIYLNKNLPYKSYGNQPGVENNTWSSMLGERS
jgi:hypothetical protein